MKNATDYETVMRSNETRDFLARQPRDYTLCRIEGDGTALTTSGCDLPYYTSVLSLTSYAATMLTAKPCDEGVIATDRALETETVYATNDLADLIDANSIAVVIRIEGMWWVTAVLHSTGAAKYNNSDPFSCVYPGSDISADCPICPCSADPWIINLPKIVCGTSSVGGTRALLLGTGDAYSCTWATDPFATGGHSFIWSLVLNVDLTATIELLREGDVIAKWTCKHFCCECRNCFQADCPVVWPSPCGGLPGEICLDIPHYGIPKKRAGATCHACANQDVPAVYLLTLDDSGCTGVNCGTLCSPGHELFAGCTPFDPIALVFAGCGWTLTGGCGAGAGNPVWSFDLSIGVTDVTLTLILTSDAGNSTAVYTKATADWSCLGINTMDLASSDAGSAGIGATATLTPSTQLVDNAGNPVMNNGVPVIEPVHADCFGCQCCYQFVWIPLPGSPGWLFESTTCTGDDPDGGTRCNAVINAVDINDYTESDNGHIFCFPA